MEQTKKRNVFGIIMRMVFFLVLSGAFLWLYHSSFSYFNDSYGLLKGPKEPVVVGNLMNAMDFAYIKCINCLYLFLGEKPAVVIGFHIFLRMINCLLLFFSIEKIGKPVLSGVFTLLYGIYPFVIYELYNYDGFLIAEFFCVLLLFVLSSIIKAVIYAIAAGKRRKSTVSYVGESPRLEAENQMPGQKSFKQEELTQEMLSEGTFQKGTFSESTFLESMFQEGTHLERSRSEADEGKYSSGLETGKILQVEKIGNKMRQVEVMAGNMEKEKVVKERDGIPNFLELTDEEIRRNAMIAAGLLSPEEEKKPETDENGAAKKKSKKKAKDKGEKKPLFRKGREQSVKTKAIEEAEASTGNEWTERQEKQPDIGFKQSDMKLKQPDIMPEQSDIGTGIGAEKSDVKWEQPDTGAETLDRKSEMSDIGAGISKMEPESSNAGGEQPSMSHTQFIENPLPVPKRHVKKEMDYEYQVPEEKMHYDIEEPDKNYFDVV